MGRPNRLTLGLPLHGYSLRLLIGSCAKCVPTIGGLQIQRSVSAKKTRLLSQSSIGIRQKQILRFLAFGRFRVANIPIGLDLSRETELRFARQRLNRISGYRCRRNCSDLDVYN
jgi:hypothetical protein